MRNSSKRRNQLADAAPKLRSRGSLSTEAPVPSLVTLPTDLAGSLTYLDDAQIERLQEAVAVEINRRKQGASPAETLLETTRTSETPSASSNTADNLKDLPQAKANLIRASFEAGLKPAAIARNFRIPQSLVNRTLSGMNKPKLKAGRRQTC
jgi:hypothetical protein